MPRGTFALIAIGALMLAGLLTWNAEATSNGRVAVPMGFTGSVARMALRVTMMAKELIANREQNRYITPTPPQNGTEAVALRASGALARAPLIASIGGPVK